MFRLSRFDDDGAEYDRRRFEQLIDDAHDDGGRDPWPFEAVTAAADDTDDGE